MLLDLVTAPGDCLGYIPFDREKDLVQTINTIRYKALIQCKTGRDANSRYTFVALGIMEEEDVVIKGSINDHECVLLKRLASLQVQHIPNVCLDGQFENGLRYMVMKPYGKQLELSNDGIGVILGCLYDVARTMELAASYHIFHRDIKPSNIVLHNGCGYLIDWGVATEDSEVNNLSATLAYCSIKVLGYLCAHEQGTLEGKVTYILDDDVESLFYIFVGILCDGVLVWDKGRNPRDVQAYRMKSLHDNFEGQIKYVPAEFRDVVREFRALLFGDKDRKRVAIGTVIDFLDSKAYYYRER
ncbi:kinase-like domain-containing protein [Terfezia claveryi]|nr:kinase-like domain-containing protein [Terfezia claveryi]